MSKCRDCRFYDETNDNSGWCNVYKSGQNALTDCCPAFAGEHPVVDVMELSANLIEDYLNAKHCGDEYIDFDTNDVCAIVGLLEIGGAIPSER